MDLSLLPSSCSKLNKIDKTAIENDRKEFWDLFYKKYEEIGETDKEEERIQDIDDPMKVMRRHNKFRNYNCKGPSSRTFRKWVREHEDEIDELTTIAGPVGEDEEEIGDELDEESSSDDESEDEVIPVDDDRCCVETNGNCDSSDSDSDSDLFHPFPRALNVSGISKTFSPNRTNSNLLRQCLQSPKVKTPNKNSSFREKFRNSPRSSVVSDEVDSNEDSQSFCDLIQSLPSSLQVSEARTPVKTKLLLSSSSALNNSASKSRKNESLIDLNLSCISCGNITDYSIDMGFKQDNFECDDCMLGIHPDCQGECKLCKDVAGQVEARWIQKRSFLETTNHEFSGTM